MKMTGVLGVLIVLILTAALMQAGFLWVMAQGKEGDVVDNTRWPCDTPPSPSISVSGTVTDTVARCEPDGIAFRSPTIISAMPSSGSTAAEAAILSCALLAARLKRCIQTAPMERRFGQ